MYQGYSLEYVVEYNDDGDGRNTTIETWKTLSEHYESPEETPGYVRTFWTVYGQRADSEKFSNCWDAISNFKNEENARKFFVFMCDQLKTISEQKQRIEAEEKQTLKLLENAVEIAPQLQKFVDSEHFQDSADAREFIISAVKIYTDRENKQNGKEFDWYQTIDLYCEMINDQPEGETPDEKELKTYANAAFKKGEQ